MNVLHRSETTGVERALCFLLVLVCVLQSGCGTMAPPKSPFAPGESRGVVAVVPAQYAPEANFATFAKGRDVGAAKGAAIGAGIGLSGTALSAAAATGPYAPLTLLFGAIITVALTAVGAVKGAVDAIPAERAKQIDTAIQKSSAARDLQRGLGVQLTVQAKESGHTPLREVSVSGPVTEKERPTYAELRGKGFDTVFEVAVSKFGLASCEDVVIWFAPIITAHPFGRCASKELRFFVAANARLVNVANGREIFARQFGYVSEHREGNLWLENEGRAIEEEFEKAYREIARQMLESLDQLANLESLELPAPSSFGGIPGAGDPLYGLCWLAPEYPAARPALMSEMLSLIFSRPADLCPGANFHFGVADDLMPTLRWNAFPREMDRRALTQDVLKKIDSVSYDLRIWEVDNCARGSLIYERFELPLPEHTLEIPLKPTNRYFWSIRAHYLFDGRPMTTRWAQTGSEWGSASCYAESVPDNRYHRFSTP